MSKRYEVRVLDYLRNYMDVGREVKKIIRRIDPDARVFLFGSVVKGRYTASSDIDVLVVTEKMDAKSRMLVEVYKSIEAPVQLHVTTSEKFAGWYLRFIPPDELVEV